MHVLSPGMSQERTKTPGEAALLGSETAASLLPFPSKAIIILVIVKVVIIIVAIILIMSTTTITMKDIL